MSGILTLYQKNKYDFDNRDSYHLNLFKGNGFVQT